METTVTMSLNRFKELEAKEIAVNEILMGYDWPLVIENLPYGTIVYVKHPDQINEQLIKAAKDATTWGETMRLKAVEASKKC